ncbi:g2952 [Coccomyxa viridis]|uniref:G2952 protein n=1 Tax=Coccomyxa viridis TaxID=1274662 RepID=A0ABP1FPL6_9CHLO
MLESSQTAPEERGQSKPYWLQDLHKPQEWPLNLRLDPRLPGEAVRPDATLSREHQETDLVPMIYHLATANGQSEALHHVLKRAKCAKSTKELQEVSSTGVAILEDAECTEQSFRNVV